MTHERTYKRQNFLSIAILVLTTLTSIEIDAAEKIYIPVGQARIKKSILAFPETKQISSEAQLKGLGRQVQDTVGNDLEFTHLFTMQKPDAFIEKPEAGLTFDSFKMTDWSTIGTEFLIKTGIALSDGEIAYEVRLYDVLGAKQILGKRYVAKLNEPKILGHTVANDIVEALTGKPGIFFTKLLMVCDKTRHKEVWITDFDGSNPKPLTDHKTLAFAPAWNPDNRKFVYSLYTKNSRNVKNIDLYEYDFATKKSRLLSNRKGINSGAAYSPDGKNLALTMSFLGNPEIFLLEPISRQVTRLTKSFGFDVDPAWSPDGKKIAFVSSRSNQPMVYVSDVQAMMRTPEKATRITFAGKYNATPSWAPSGDKIAFAGFNESHFDIFLMNTDGSNLERLTKNEGSNEDPFFSPDGNFIVFSSNRSGQKKTYMITVDGQNTWPVAQGLGNCVAPKWSGFSKNPL